MPLANSVIADVAGPLINFPKLKSIRTVNLSIYLQWALYHSINE